MKNTSQEYDAVITVCRTLFNNKMKDYGCAWRILRLPSLTDQIFIKAQRIRSLQENEVRKVNEDDKSYLGNIDCILANQQSPLNILEANDNEILFLKERVNSLNYENEALKNSINEFEFKNSTLNRRLKDIENEKESFFIERNSF